MKQIICFSGAISNGKSTAAGLLCAALNNKVFRWSMATPLKKLSSFMLGVSTEQLEEIKNDTVIRQFLQFLGTDIMRDIVNEYVWVDAAIRAIDSCQNELIVIDDIRFPNELDELKKKWNVFLVFISRQNSIGLQQQPHSSESHYDYLREQADLIIENTTLDALKNDISSLASNFSNLC